MNCLKRLCVLWKANDGAALVELAMVTPVLLLIALGAVDVGRAYYVSLEVANAAHAGAEYGSQNPSNTTGMTAAALQSAPDLPNLIVAAPTWGCECSDGSSFTASCSPTPVCSATASRSNKSVHMVKVTASAIYQPLVPWPVIPASITLSNTATMRGN